jgi:hypothetical protein
VAKGLPGPEMPTCRPRGPYQVKLTQVKTQPSRPNDMQVSSVATAIAISTVKKLPAGLLGSLTADVVAALWAPEVSLENEK